MKINAREKIEMEINFLQEEEDNIWGHKRNFKYSSFVLPHTKRWRK